MWGLLTGWATGLAKFGVTMTAAGLALTSSGVMVWAFSGASIAEAMGVAIGCIVASTTVARIWQSEIIRTLEESNRFLKAENKTYREERREYLDAADNERARAREYRLRMEQGGLLHAAEMVDRFLEGKKAEKSG